jgi:hypothetical protein
MADSVANDDVEFAFCADATRLLELTRAIGHGRAPNDSQDDRCLIRVGLVDASGLTERGEALFKLAYVQRDSAAAVHALGQSLRVLLPYQVLEQELVGFGTVSTEAIHDLLGLHRSLPADSSNVDVRSFLRSSNRLGIVKYSQRDNTVRVVATTPDAPLAGESADLAAIVSPKTPFSNVVRLRRILRALTGAVLWADPHFGHRALEELLEVDTDKVLTIRIISGDAANVVTEKARANFTRFRDELAARGASAEWRVDAQADRDWHDRWLLGGDVAYNMPPVNTLFKGDYSEMLPTPNRPPVDEWWSRAQSLI